MAGKAPLKVAWVSLGCPKNLVDSEKMLAILGQAGLVVGAEMDEADAIVINTCGFLSAARRESLAAIKEALNHKCSGKARRVVVAGCLVNRDAEKLYEAGEIDAIVGVNNRQDIVEAVMGGGRLSRFDEYEIGAAVSDAGRFRLTPAHTAYLRISEGCSRKCTFCTIPAIRGPFRSKAPSDVLAEAAELVGDGAVELNIIGQDTTAYGMDLSLNGDGPTLASLLRELNSLEDLRWMRLLYTYPNRFSDELIKAVCRCERVVPYIDIPLQHISTEILRRMGRGTTRRQIETLLGRLRSEVSNLVLRTTLIVGFPGESEQQFQELLDFVRDFRFDALGVFAFSPEEGTPAARMRNQIPDDIKAQRTEAIMLAQQEIAFAKNRELIGSTVEVLVDGIDQQGYCFGRYYGQAPDIDGICILSEPQPPGTFVRCKVIDINGYDLIVEVP